jgi:NAD(P)H-dependent FMN reductase
MKILGICGSLRENSTNKTLLHLAKANLSQHEWTEGDLFSLPYFDPDNQYSDQTPKSVLDMRKLAAACDIIFIATPEYAHGLPGVLKNALEWLFHEGTQKKPVYLVIGSGQGEHTKAQLIEILTTMDFQISENQTLMIKSPRSKISTEGKFTDLNHIYNRGNMKNN